MNLGNLSPTVIELPLVGKVAISLILRDEDGAAFLLDVTQSHNFQISLNPNGAALITRTEDDGITLLEPYANGEVYIVLTAEEAALLSAQQLYSFLYVVRDDENNVVLSNAGHVLPLLSPVANVHQAVGEGGPGALLSTVTVNQLDLSGLEGGAGYLDGVATVGQPVPCIVNFLLNGQLNAWVLEAGDETGDGYVRPLDYNAVTNIKRWRQVL